MPIKRLIFISLVFAFTAGTGVFAADQPGETKDQEDNFKYRTITTKEGLTFRVPEDMPIENRNGIQAPIPFDEYMYGKFHQMDAQLKRIEAKLDAIEKLLTSSTKKETRGTSPTTLSSVS